MPKRGGKKNVDVSTSSATLSPISRSGGDNDTSDFSSILGALGGEPPRSTAKARDPQGARSSDINIKSDGKNEDKNDGFGLSPDQRILRRVLRGWRDWARVAAIARREDRLREEFDRLEELSMEMENERAWLQAEIKDRNARFAFHNLGTMFILFIVAAVLYYNYILIAPFLRSVLLALTCAVCLSPVRDVLVRGMAALDAAVAPVPLAVGVSAVWIAGIAMARGDDFARLVMAAVLLVIDYAILFMPRRQVVATVLTFAVAIMLTFPFFFFIRSCAEESRKFPLWVTSVIGDHPELATLLTDYRTHPSFIQLEQYLASWGIIVPTDDEIYGHIDSLSRYAAGHVSTFFASLISSVVSNAGDFALSTSIFFSSLYYFMLSKESLVAEIARLSPFAAADNTRLYKTIYTTTQTVFLTSFAIAALHSAVTFLCFAYVGSEFVYVFTFLSGFLSLVPVLSSWMIWLPAGVLLYLTNDTRGSLVMFVSHGVTVYVVDPWILGTVPAAGGGYYTTGLSIALGVYGFGPVGVIAGPLLVALSFSLREIYAIYQLPTPQDDRVNQMSMATGAGATGRSVAMVTPFAAAAVGHGQGNGQYAAAVRTPGQQQQPSSVVQRHLFKGLQGGPQASNHSPMLKRALGKSLLD